MKGYRTAQLTTNTQTVVVYVIRQQLKFFQVGTDAVYIVLIQKKGKKLARSRSIELKDFVDTMLTCSPKGDIPKMERLLKLI